MAHQKKAYSEARARANAAYDQKTYKTIGIRLRLVEDADLIASYEQAKLKGLKGRDWLRNLKED